MKRCRSKFRFGLAFRLAILDLYTRRAAFSFRRNFGPATTQGGNVEAGVEASAGGGTWWLGVFTKELDEAAGHRPAS
jgi:hypothetical protein